MPETPEQELARLREENAKLKTSTATTPWWSSATFKTVLSGVIPAVTAKMTESELLKLGLSKEAIGWIVFLGPIVAVFAAVLSRAASETAVQRVEAVAVVAADAAVEVSRRVDVVEAATGTGTGVVMISRAESEPTGSGGGAIPGWVEPERG